VRKFYFDTSIWLDLFENRDEPNLLKGTWARKLITKIISKDDKVVYSDLTLTELNDAGYSEYDIEELLKPLGKILIFLETTDKQLGKGTDLSAKRDVPKGDAIHALIARDSGADLVSLDKHFDLLSDIIKRYSSRELV